MWWCSQEIFQNCNCPLVDIQDHLTVDVLPTTPSISMPVNNFLRIWVWVSDWSRTVIFYVCIVLLFNYWPIHHRSLWQSRPGYYYQDNIYSLYHGKLKQNRNWIARLILRLIITQWTPWSVSQVSITTKTGTYKLPVNIALTDCWGSALVKMFCLNSQLNFTTDQLESWSSEILQLQNYKIAEKQTFIVCWLDCIVNEFSVDIFCPIFTV